MTPQSLNLHLTDGALTPKPHYLSIRVCTHDHTGMIKPRRDGECHKITVMVLRDSGHTHTMISTTVQPQDHSNPHTIVRTTRSYDANWCRSSHAGDHIRTTITRSTMTLASSQWLWSHRDDHRVTWCQSQRQRHNDNRHRWHTENKHGWHVENNHRWRVANCPGWQHTNEHLDILMVDRCPDILTVAEAPTS